MDNFGMRLSERGLLLQNEIVATLLPEIERQFGTMVEMPATGVIAASWQASPSGE
jgi:hypothetical protein